MEGAPNRSNLIHVNPKFQKPNVFINPRFVPNQQLQETFTLQNFYSNVQLLQNLPPGTIVNPCISNPPVLPTDSRTYVERGEKKNSSKFSWKRHKLPHTSQPVTSQTFGSANLLSTDPACLKWSKRQPSKTKFSWSRRPSLEKSFGHSSKSPPVIKKSPKHCKKSSNKVKILSRNKLHLISPSGKRLVRLGYRGLKERPSQKYKSKRKSKFKLDNRKQEETKLPQRIEEMFPRTRYTRNNITFPKKESNEKLEMSNKKVISIGGILYRATHNKLTRTNLPTKQEPPEKLEGPGQRHILNIQGERFLLANNGRSLKRLPNQRPPQSLTQRIHFGGVTFQRTSDNKLVRTNTHRTRHILTSARHRSIAFLNAQRRKINTPCMIYQKLGKCQRSEGGLCPFTHLKKNINICKRFLRGDCSDGACLLSHDIGYNKLPTCRYFLEGSCGREGCPYLHVKVSDSAAICRDFLQGYCVLAQQCTLRHVNICPVFDATGKCGKGKKCPYPHKKPRARPANAAKEKEKRQRKRAADENCSNDKAKHARYYGNDEPQENIRVLPTRSRLETLPSFIALD